MFSNGDVIKSMKNDVLEWHFYIQSFVGHVIDDIFEKSSMKLLHFNIFFSFIISMEFSFLWNLLLICRKISLINLILTNVQKHRILKLHFWCIFLTKQNYKSLVFCVSLNCNFQQKYDAQMKTKQRLRTFLQYYQ